MGKFKPGEVNNPTGRPKESQEVRLFRNKVKDEYKRFLFFNLNKKYSELIEMSKDKELKAYEAMALKLISEATVKGSIRHMEIILKLLQIDVDSKQINIKTDRVMETGLEQIPTEKLEKIKEIMESE